MLSIARTMRPRRPSASSGHTVSTLTRRQKPPHNDTSARPYIVLARSVIVPKARFAVRIPPMKRFALAAAIVILGIGGLTVASQKSASAMSGAANKWLASLTPEQKQKAVFAFDSEEASAPRSTIG